jgi:hypothetical protein
VKYRKNRPFLECAVSHVTGSQDKAVLSRDHESRADETIWLIPAEQNHGRPEPPRSLKEFRIASRIRRFI